MGKRNSRFGKPELACALHAGACYRRRLRICQPYILARYNLYSAAGGNEVAARKQLGKVKERASGSEPRIDF